MVHEYHCFGDWPGTALERFSADRHIEQLFNLYFPRP